MRLARHAPRLAGALRATARPRWHQLDVAPKLLAPRAGRQAVRASSSTGRPAAPPSQPASAPRRQPPPPVLPSGAVDGSGYLSTGASGRRLFYLLQEAAVAPGTPPTTTPLAVWLQGGPGASALTGCFHEHGRWTTDEVSGELGRNPCAWADGGLHMLYIEQPAGTGFSDPGSAGPPSSVAEAATDLVAALTDFFERARPDLAACPLLLTGESHAGRFVPDTAAAWLAHGPRRPRLAGIAVGNSFTDPRPQTLTLAPRLHAAGLLDAAQAAEAAAVADTVVASIDAGRWKDAHDARQALLDDLTARALGPAGTLLHTGRARGYDPDNTVTALLHTPGARAALGVPPDAPWVRKSEAVKLAMWNDKMVSSVPAVTAVLRAGIPALFFQGVHDAQDGPFSNEAWIDNLVAEQAWPGAPAYAAAPRRTITRGGAAVAHARSGGGLSTVAIRGAGHMAARDAPAVTRAVVVAWAAAAVDGGEVEFGRVGEV